MAAPSTRGSWSKSSMPPSLPAKPQHNEPQLPSSLALPRPNDNDTPASRTSMMSGSNLSNHMALTGQAAGMNDGLTRYPSQAGHKPTQPGNRTVDRARLSSNPLSKRLSVQHLQLHFPPDALSQDHAVPREYSSIKVLNVAGVPGTAPGSQWTSPQTDTLRQHNVVKASMKWPIHDDDVTTSRGTTLVSGASAAASDFDDGDEDDDDDDDEYDGKPQVQQDGPPTWPPATRHAHQRLNQGHSECGHFDNVSVMSGRSIISSRVANSARGSYTGSGFISSLRRLTEGSVFGVANTASPASVISTLVDTKVGPSELLDEFSVVDEQREPKGHARFVTMQEQLLHPESQESSTSLPLPSRFAPNDPRPVTRELIEDMFIDLQRRFGFQADSVRNQLEYMLTIIDSRVARMSLNMAVASLHADIIGGENANYRQWYVTTFGPYELGPDPGADPMGTLTQKVVRSRWRKAMKRLTQTDRAMQTALWFCIWGEAANVRFMPECLCFLFKLACDHLMLDKAAPAPTTVLDGAFLNKVITPLYRAYREQGYKVSEDGKLVRQRRDHSDIVGYDDLNDMFRDWDALAALATKGGQKLLDMPASERYWMLDQVEYKLRKTYLEKRTPLHLVTNFSRIWILHLVGLYYMAMGQADFMFPEAMHRARHWSLVACGSAIGVIVTMVAKWAEYSFLPITVKRTAYLVWCQSVLFVILIANLAPTAFIYWFTGQDLAQRGAGPVAMGVTAAHLILSVVTSCYLLIVPPADLFRRSWLQTRQDLVEHGFIAHFLPPTPWDHALSLGTWGAILFIKFIGGYFYL
ncbi:hypothetical protein GGF31_005519, partial [Allomyces arbusculus]